LKKLKLYYYDKKNSTIENVSFFKNLLNSSGQGFLISVFFIAFLVCIDYGARQLAIVFCNSTNNLLNTIADWIYLTNTIIGVKYIDYFKDIIVIVAGILGVILGLFFTTFLNIITSKYSNINSIIVNELLKQKVINRYFKLLAILVASSIIFQLLLIIGYNPTFISCFLFTFTVIISLLAFISLGRYILIYFNAGNIVLDLIESCNKILNRVYDNKIYFKKSKRGIHILGEINRNIKKIELIVEESTKPQLNNTALDSISDQLLSFALYYNSFKHTFPSNKNWHNKVLKYKRWEEASSTEFELFSTTGSPIIPQTEDDYFSIEKQLIKTQFLIFKYLSNTESRIQLISNQHKYLQIISVQCEIEIFDIFFDNLETFIKDNLIESDSQTNKRNLQLVSLYSILLTQYLVGFNHNLGQILSKNQLKEVAKAIHYDEDKDSIMQFPYKIRIWADNYQQKLSHEKQIENQILTPLFYTEYAMAFQFQYIFKNYFVEISKSIHKRINSFSNYLNTQKHSLESLEFLSESLDIYKKVEFFSGIIEEKISSEVSPLNLKNEEEFNFSERKELLLDNKKSLKNSINAIWEVGWSGYSVNNNELPDFFGNFYQLICEDILNKAFNITLDEFIEYLPKFYAYNILYIESLRKKIDPNRIETTTLKLFPIIVDLFEISSIAILLFKIHDNSELQNCFFNFWDNAHKKNEQKDKVFWEIVFSTYQYFNQPQFGLSNPSYIKEHKRRNQIEKYLKESDLTRLITKKEKLILPTQCYVTDINDIYIKEVVQGLSVNGYRGLDSNILTDIMIEYFLRTRISLKNLKIKETRYGKSLKRRMERDSK